LIIVHLTRRLIVVELRWRLIQATDRRRLVNVGLRKRLIVDFRRLRNQAGLSNIRLHRHIACVRKRRPRDTEV